MTKDPTRDEGELALDSPELVNDAFETLCRQAEHSLKLRAPRLDFPFLHSTGLLTALTPLITGDRRNHVHILVDDEQHLLDTGNRVIDIARKFSSYLSVRRLPPEYADSGEIYLIADAAGYLYLGKADHYPAAFSEHDPGRARQLDRRFRQLWERSVRIAELHTLGL